MSVTKDKKKSSKELRTKLVKGEDISKARNSAMKDVDGWDDKEVSEYLGIKESAVNRVARVDAIDKRTEYYVSIGNPEEKSSGGSTMASGGEMGEKYKPGDFVFANRDTRNPSSKTPFIVAYWSNDAYYVMGDGSHYLKEEDLTPATEKDFDDFYGENAESFKIFAQGGRAGRPSPSDSATLYPIGHQQIGNDGNWWEIRADVRGVQSWKKIQPWQVKQASASAPMEESVPEPKAELTDLQKELLSKGFINDDLTLTNKGKRVAELHKYCFPMEAHPFSHVYHTFDYFYPNRSIQYVAIDKVPMYTGTLELYEAGTHLPETIRDLAVHNPILERQIQISKSNRVEFKPYSYCPGISDNEMGLGFFILANFVNNNELYIDSATFNYVNKHYQITRWEADASKAPLLYGYNEKNLQVVIPIKKKVVGLNEVISMYDRQKTMDAIITKNPEVAIRGEKMSEFTSKSKPKIAKEMSEEVKQAIAGLELMIEIADTEEEKVLYQQEIDKLKA